MFMFPLKNVARKGLLVIELWRDVRIGLLQLNMIYEGQLTLYVPNFQAET